MAAILLAYISPFNLTPIIFLGGAFSWPGAGDFFPIAAAVPGVWEHSTHQFRFVGSLMLYVMVYWTTVGLFTNVKEQREFLARYEPYIQEGRQHGFNFYYLDYAGSYERIDSPELNKLIAENNPERVRIVLEVVKDFGKLRAYSVRSVESITVDKAWTDGNPPWAALREP